MSCISQYMCGDWERLSGPDIPVARQGILRDNNTGETYNKDSECLIRTKCGAILIGNIFRTVAVLIYDLGKLIWDIAKIAAMAIWNFGKEFAAACKGENSTFAEGEKASVMRAFGLLGKGLFVELPCEAGRDIWHAIRDPLCGIAIEFAVLYGLADPLNARKMIGNIEKYGFNEGLPAPMRINGRLVTTPGTFYLAPCFQNRAPDAPPEDPDPVNPRLPDNLQTAAP